MIMLIIYIILRKIKVHTLKKLFRKQQDTNKMYIKITYNVQ